MNSKGVMISHIINIIVKWTTTIVYIFLTNLGRPSDIRKNMLEVIKNIAFNGKCYNWVTHVADLIKINCERCQEIKGSIQFPILLILITRTHISLVQEV